MKSLLTVLALVLALGVSACKSKTDYSDLDRIDRPGAGESAAE